MGKSILLSRENTKQRKYVKSKVSCESTHNNKYFLLRIYFIIYSLVQYFHNMVFMNITITMCRTCYIISILGKMLFPSPCKLSINTDTMI